MEETKTYLGQVDPSPLLMYSAQVLRNQGLQRFCFLLQDRQGIWTTAYASTIRPVHLTAKEALFLASAEKDATFILPEQCIGAHHPLVSKLSLMRLRLKMRRHAISTIMPIFYRKEMVGIILFADTQTAYWHHACPQYIKNINKELAHDIHWIEHYNRTMTWLQGTIADEASKKSVAKDACAHGKV